MKGRIFKYIFITVQLVLYFSFLTLDISGENITLSNYLKFAVVALCFLYVLIKGSYKSDRQLLFLRMALLFTLVSDIQILLTDYYFTGVLTFIAAQQFHGFRISVLDSTKTRPVRDFFIRLLYQAITCIAVCLILWKTGVTINSLLVASAFYFISLLTNTVRSVRLALKCRNRKSIVYLAVGLVLFLLCDINVGLFNLSDFLPVGPVYDTIYSVSSVLMWAFYAPSQVMISLSGENKEEKG